MKFSVPERKITELKRSLSRVSPEGKVTSRFLSQITGKLSSMHLSIGPLVRLMTRNMYTEIQKHPKWDAAFHPSHECFDEISFWRCNLNVENGYAIKPKQATSQILFTDASDFAYGGYLLKRLGKVICHGKFDREQCNKSSTERELLAIKYCLQSFATILRHEAVNIRTDNFAASRIVEIGSSKLHLHNLALEIFKICVAYDIRIFPTWIPREDNQYADYFSKMVDTDDWSIDNRSFVSVCQKFGFPTVDRFADNINKKVDKFNSKYYCRGTDAINAFTQNWADDELNWLSPPIKYIIPTIRHLQLCKAKGILILPQWPPSHFCPVIHNGTSYESFIKDVIILQPYYSSTCDYSVFIGNVDFYTLALLVDGS